MLAVDVNSARLEQLKEGLKSAKFHVQTADVIPISIDYRVQIDSLVRSQTKTASGPYSKRQRRAWREAT